MNNAEFLRQISRAEILLSQSRYAQAEEILEHLMTAGYEGTDIFRMMAIAKMGLQKYEDVEQLCKMIIEQNPNEAFAFYLLANIRAIGRKFAEARSMMDEAIRLEPAKADFHAFYANIWLQTKDFQKALESADRGLALDAENIEALNARSGALSGLGRKTEAFETIDKSLAADPGNPDTHANMGWGLLHMGKSDEALHHFKIALREDPMHDYAKSGMLEAMKSKFPVYRYFLMVMLWMGKLKGVGQWAIIIVGYIFYRMLFYLVENNHNLMPFLLPVIILLGLFFISTWIFSPIMNLYLLTNSFGKYTLTKDQKTSASLVGIALSLSSLSFLLYFFVSDNPGLISTGGFFFLMMIPLGSMFIPYQASARKKLIVSTIFLGLMVCINAIVCLTQQVFATDFTLVPLIGLIAYQWYANYLIIKE